MCLVAFGDRLADAHAHVHELGLHGIRKRRREGRHMFAVIWVEVGGGVGGVDAREEGSNRRLVARGRRLELTLADMSHDGLWWQ